MKIHNRVVYISLGVLFAAVVILALLNPRDSDLRRSLEENREFQIRSDSEIITVVGLRALLDLTPEEFTTTLASSIGAPREVVLEGVELRYILEAFAIDTSEAKSFIFSGLDGYYSPLTAQEVQREGSIYVCFSMNGELLKKQSEGGYGPFMMVIRGSRFAQRWCKYVEAVEIVGL